MDEGQNLFPGLFEKNTYISNEYEKLKTELADKYKFNGSACTGAKRLYKTNYRN